MNLDRALRRTAFASGLIGLVFWGYTFHFISNVPPGDGTGFQWLAEFPLTIIFLVLSLPALMMSWSSRLSAVAAGLGISGLIAFAIVWQQLLVEFAGYK